MQGCGKSLSCHKSEAREESDSVASRSGGEPAWHQPAVAAVAARRAASRHSRQKHLQVAPAAALA